jgi:hypothetical protein
MTGVDHDVRNSPEEGWGPGSCVSVAVPRRSYVSWVLYGGGRLVEIYIGGERTGGVYLTLSRASLPALTEGLRGVRDTIPGSHVPGAAGPPTAVRGARPYVTGRRPESGR